MPRFVYQVRDARGSAASGVLNATGLEEASRILRGEGHVIIDLHEQVAVAEPVDRSGVNRRVRVRRDDVIFFSNQLAVMVDTGVSLPDAIDSIAEQTTHQAFHQVLTDLSDHVKAGTAFSAALARYPKVFGELFVSLVKASEATGTLGRMLQRIAKYLQQERALRRRVKGAVSYPLAMLGFCVLVVTGMLVFIIPRFEKIYAGKSAALPVPTQMLIAFSDVLVSYWPFIIVGIAAAVVAACMFLRRPEGREALDSVRIQIPVLGGMFRRACLARSLRTLATMVASGVSLLEGLEITSEVAGNVHYRRVWLNLSERLKRGASLSEEMYDFPLIPRSISQMVSAGERSGKLGTVLDRVAEFCEEDLDISVKTVTSFIEPVMIVVMGAIVGGIALALLLPVFTLSRVVGG